MRVLGWWLGGLLACASTGVAELPAPVEPVPVDEAPTLPDGWLEQVVGGEADAELPMVVMVHGLGDRPESMLQVMAGLPGPVRVIAPRAPTPWGDKGYAWFTSRVRDGDTALLEAQMRVGAEAMAAQLREVQQARPTKGKPVIAGFSQGGMLSFTVAAHHPDVVAKAVPVAGWLPPGLVPSHAPPGAPPIVALHGDADSVLPLAPTQASVDGLRAAGFTVELQVFEGVEHQIPADVRAALYQQVATLP